MDEYMTKEKKRKAIIVFLIKMFFSLLSFALAIWVVILMWNS